MTNAKVHLGFRDDRKIQKHCSVISKKNLRVVISKKKEHRVVRYNKLKQSR